MASSRPENKKQSFFDCLERLCQSESETEYDYYEPHMTETKPEAELMPNSDRDSHVKLPNRCAIKSAGDNHSLVVTDSSHLGEPLATRALPRTDVAPATGARMKRALSGRVKSVSAKETKKSKGELDSVPDEERIFHGLVFFFIPNNNVAKPRNMRIQLARKHGATWTTVYDNSVTHVIVEPHIHYTEAAKAFPNRQIPNDVVLVRATWIGESIGSMYLRDVVQSRFRVDGAPPLSGLGTISHPSTSGEHRRDVSPGETRAHAGESAPSPNTPNHEMERATSKFQSPCSSSDFGGADSFFSAVSEPRSGIDPELSDNSHSKTPLHKNQGFQCMKSHSGKNDDNPNQRTIAVLQEMATYYDHTGDHWRTTAYRQAISALRKQKTLIATREGALAVPQIGSRLADKIEEIVTTDRLRQLENTKDDPHAKVLILFMGIYDVGPKQALQWIAQGHRTLADLVERAELSQNQRVGIARYDDFSQRIPRAEVAEHASVVQTACRHADKDIQVIIGGSYRRGSADSGDIDLLVSKPDADLSQIRSLFTSAIIPFLTESGFIKCTLASSRSSSGTGSKWHGASCLHGSSVWRRIDLLFVPWNELGAALLYFTGNDIFNRSMRLLASKKGMRLNQHGLYRDVIRGEGRKRLTKGTLMEGKSEEKIFEILGVPWREPSERNC